MPEQYDFHKATIRQQDDGTIKIDNPNGFTTHQLPDLIRTLQRIHASTQADYARSMIDQMKQELKAATGSKPDLRPVNGQGPEGVA